MPQQAEIPAATKAEAAAWIARLHAGTRTAADEEAFAVWLAAKPENAAAFEAVTTVWDITGALSPALLETAPAPAYHRSRRGFLAGMGTLLAAGAGFGVWQQAYAGVYETAVGEQKHVRLSDGTLVFLNTDTRIRERFTDRTRAVEFDRGQANFRVRPEAERPFMVGAAGEQILADHTSFDVRRNADKVCVLLLKGRAMVLANRAGQRRKWLLTAGERLIAAKGGGRIDTPDLARLTAWQTGQAIFDNETLADAVTEMNRYTTMRIVIVDRTLRHMRISGVYSVGDNEAFARSVSRLLPIKVERAADHLKFLPGTAGVPAG